MCKNVGQIPGSPSRTASSCSNRYIQGSGTTSVVDLKVCQACLDTDYNQTQCFQMYQTCFWCRSIWYLAWFLCFALFWKMRWFSSDFLQSFSLFKCFPELSPAPSPYFNILEYFGSFGFPLAFVTSASQFPGFRSQQDTFTEIQKQKSIIKIRLNEQSKIKSNWSRLKLSHHDISQKCAFLFILFYFYFLKVQF